MLTLDLGQFRTTLETGGILSVQLVGQGGSFHVTAETRRGEAALTKARSTTLREFRSIQRATELLRELGIREFSVDTKNWRPEQIAIGRPVRPDRAKVMREAYAASDIVRTLEAAIAEADDPNTVWHDAEDVFAELEAKFAS